MTRALTAALFALTLPGSLLAQPVADPNGTVTGRFGDTNFDLPVLCERAPFLVVRSHDQPGAPGLEIALAGGTTAIEVRTGDDTVQFGAPGVDAAFPLTLEGEVNDTAYAFEVTCPEDMAG